MHAEREPTLRRLFELPEERAAGPNFAGLKFGERRKRAGRNFFRIPGKRNTRHLTSTNHAQHATDLVQQGEGQIVTLIGTVFYTLHGGSETCNCQLTGDESVVDFHIGVGFGAFPLSDSVLNQLRGGTEYSVILSPSDQHLLDQPSVVVEMTPYYREQFHPA
jgi:hypothetical protein